MASSSPTVKVTTSAGRALADDVAHIAMEPWTSSGGDDFLKMIITTPGNVRFTTLRLSLKTDADIDERAAVAYSYIGTDNLYPLQAGTGTFKSGVSDWLGYSAVLNESPHHGYEGLTLVLSTPTPHTSPAEAYIKLVRPATYIQTTHLEEIQLADDANPSNLMPTPDLISSLVPHSDPPSPSPPSPATPPPSPPPQKPDPPPSPKPNPPKIAVPSLPPRGPPSEPMESANAQQPGGDGGGGGGAVVVAVLVSLAIVGIVGLYMWKRSGTTAMPVTHSCNGAVTMTRANPSCSANCDSPYSGNNGASSTEVTTQFDKL